MAIFINLGLFGNNNGYCKYFGCLYCDESYGHYLLPGSGSERIMCFGIFFGKSNYGYSLIGWWNNFGGYNRVYRN